MKEVDTLSTALRTMYSFLEAAALVGCSVDDLLQYGERRDLPILALVPENILVYCTNIDLLELAEPMLTPSMRRMKESYLHGIRPIARQDIQLLALEPIDCRLIASHGEAYRSVFLTGVIFTEEGDPLLVEPPALGVHDGYFDMRPLRRFACYLANYHSHNPITQTLIVSTKIRLTIDTLRIRHHDLVSLNLFHVDDKKFAKFDNGFRERPYMSDRLIYLNRGAWHFWDCSHPEWSAPSANKVESWFRDECGFPTKVASGAAQILRQSYKNWDQEKYEKTKEKGELNMFDAVVQLSTSWMNADLGLGDRADQIDTYPKRIEALKMLKTKFGFAHHTALAAWHIARPEHAKSIGRPRAFDN